MGGIDNFYWLMFWTLAGGLGMNLVIGILIFLNLRDIKVIEISILNFVSTLVWNSKAPS